MFFHNIVASEPLTVYCILIGITVALYSSDGFTESATHTEPRNSKNEFNKWPEVEVMRSGIGKLTPLQPG